MSNRMKRVLIDARSAGHISCSMQEISGLCDGRSLRDWFAGQALAGLVSACNSDGMWMGNNPPDTSYAAFEMADAMIKAREAQDDD